jgi:DNA invertase Pin-like site-specific DNA recombinase
LITSNGHQLKRAVIYARVSTEEQRRAGFSIPSQIRLLEEKMKADGVVVAREPIVDVETGTTSEREGLKQLWELAKSGGIDLAYTFALDRLGRHIVETPYLMYKLKEETGVIFRTMDREYNFTDPMDFLLLVIQSYPGHVESRKIGERTQRGKVQKFLSGKWVGPVPFAYRRSTSGELEKVGELEPIVRKVFQTYTEKRDAKEVTRVINALYSKIIEKFTVDQMRRILTNPVYVGRPRYGKTEISAPQLSMIPADLFENVHLLLEKKTQKSKTKKERKPKSFLDNLTSHCDTGSLTFFLKQFKPHCPQCGTEMQGNGSKPSHVIEGARLPNFRCKCGYQRTIPHDAELEHLLTALSCPHCRYLEFDVTSTLDGFNEYVCRRCDFSFMLRPERSPQRILANGNSKHIPGQDNLANRNSEQDTRSPESLHRLIKRLAIPGFNLAPSAFEHLKQVNALDVETIGDSILVNLKGRTIPCGVITKQLLMEALSSLYPKTADRL